MRSLLKIFRFVFSLWLVLMPPAMAAVGGQLIDGPINRAIEAYSRIDNYTCLLDKIELVGSRYIEQKNIIFKFKKPLCVYMKWTEGPGKGYETLFCKGKYDNKLIVHPNGIWQFICLSIDPDGPSAMKNNRHSIKEAGIGFVVETIKRNYFKARNDPECTFEIMRNTLLGNKKILHIRAFFPKGRGYYGARINLYFDNNSGLPVKIVTYGWRNELLEEYYFHDMVINPILTDSQFDVENREYGFYGPIIDY